MNYVGKFRGVMLRFSSALPHAAYSVVNAKGDDLALNTIGPFR